MKSDKYKLLFSIHSASLISILIALYSKGLLYGGIVSAFVLLSLIITKDLWQINEKKENKVAKYSYQLIGSAIASYGISSYVFKNILFDYLKVIFPTITFQYNSLSPLIYLPFVLSAVFLLNYFNKDKSALGIIQNYLDSEIPEKTLQDKIKQVSESLLDDLRELDRKTNWSTKYFVPLDANVEVNYKENKKGKIMDLLKAIRKTENKLFLVLGDPGSGKSVALRKLAQDLLRESKYTSKIPIYINLKEWSIAGGWNEDKLPSPEDLNKFVFDKLIEKDIYVGDFFKKYYKKLYTAGYLYFILDSFDEIPDVLDEKDNSLLIRELSRVIYVFLRGASAGDVKGVLSSRFFRMPTKEFDAKTILEIQPFTELKIITSLKRTSKFNDNLIKYIFKSRPDLVSVSRNPFYATLVFEYVENNSGRLPTNQTEMYSDYINRTLINCLDRIEKHNLNIDIIKEYCINIANEMYSDLGLEVKIADLKKRLDNETVEAVIDILKYSKLGRMGLDDNTTFSFVHRRFAEYFIVQKLVKTHNDINLIAIPEDSKWRDALVLYCEVVEEDKAIQVAEYCMTIINNIKDPLNLKVIHSLRFLRDAFKSRTNCLDSIRENLHSFVLEQIHKNNMLINKISLEIIGLFDEDKIDNSIVYIMKANNYWLNETCFKSCRHLTKISFDLESKLFQYIDDLNIEKIIINRQDIEFSLSISDAFKKVLTYYRLKVLDLVLIFATIFSLFLFAPIFYFFMILTAQIFFSILKQFSSSTSNYRLYKFYKFIIFFYCALNLFSISSLSNPHLFTNAIIPINKLYFIPLLILSLPFPSLFKLINNNDVGLIDYFILSIKKIIRNIDILWSAFQIALLIIFFGVMYLLKTYKLLVYFFYIFVAVLFAILIYNIIKLAKEFIHDKSVIKTLNINNINSRTDVHNIFMKLKTSKGRLLFVIFLENNVRSIVGSWPDTYIFDKNRNKTANIRLACLEEKWIGAKE